MDSVDLTSSITGTCYWVADTTARTTGAAVELGGGKAAGSFAVTAGANNQVIDLSAAATGDIFSIVVKAADGVTYTNVVNDDLVLAASWSVSALAAADNTGAGVISLPNGISTGDRLIAGLVANNTTTATWPAGWSPLVTDADTDGSVHVAYRDVDGSEGCLRMRPTKTSSSPLTTSGVG